MTQMVQKNRISAEVEEKTFKTGKEETKMNENTTKKEEKVNEAEDLKKQYEALKKDKPELVARIRATAKGKEEKSKTKIKKEEVTSVKDFRNPAEKMLIEVCKELKLDAPIRIQAKAGSNSGVGALRYQRNGETVLSVRSNDIVAFAPFEYMQVGRAERAPWDKTVTRLDRMGEADLRKAMIKALKCKKLPSEWKKETGFSLSGRTAKAVVIKETAEQRIKRLQTELAEAKKMRMKKEAKPKTNRDKVLDKVAGAITPVPEPTIA